MEDSVSPRLTRCTMRCGSDDSAGVDATAAFVALTSGVTSANTAFFYLFGLLTLAVISIAFSSPQTTGRHRIDYLGAGLLSGGVGALILLATWGGTQYKWGSNEIIGLGILGLALLAAFVWQERRAAEPILPLQLFRSRIFSVANAMGFTIGMAMFGAIIFIPLFLQVVYGASPTSSGLRMLPLMACAAFTYGIRYIMSRAVEKLLSAVSFAVSTGV